MLLLVSVTQSHYRSMDDDSCPTDLLVSTCLFVDAVITFEYTWRPDFIFGSFVFSLTFSRG